MILCTDAIMTTHHFCSVNDWLRIMLLPNCKLQTVTTRCIIPSARDQPKPILLVSAVVETAAETRDTYMAVTEP